MPSDGRSPGLQVLVFGSLPGFPVAFVARKLAAYNCGDSHG